MKTAPFNHIVAYKISKVHAKRSERIILRAAPFYKEMETWTLRARRRSMKTGASYAVAFLFQQQ